MDLLDLTSNVMPVDMKEPAQVTADGYTDYVDTQGADGVLFAVYANATTADASNYIAPKLYGYTGDTPGTFTNYTRCEDQEVIGSVSSTYADTDVINSTGATLDVLSLREHKYRYYCFLLDETGTADAIIGVMALVSKRSKPGSDDTPTTGTVS